MSKFFTTAELIHEKPGMMLKHTFGTADGPDDASAFVMDLEMGSTEAVKLKTAAVTRWLNTAHQRLEASFDGSFTELAHTELFGETRRRPSS